METSKHWGEKPGVKRKLWGGILPARTALAVGGQKGSLGRVGALCEVLLIKLPEPDNQTIRAKGVLQIWDFPPVLITSGYIRGFVFLINNWGPTTCSYLYTSPMLHASRAS